jgi:drug/metabolite transporter (DMT)-like permease
MPMKTEEIHGYLYILVGATLWGVSTVVAKSLFNIGLPPEHLVLVRLTLSAFILTLIFLISDRKRLIIFFKDLPYFLVLGFIAVAGMQYTYFYTISKIQVGPAVLMQYLAIFWVAIYAFFFQREPISVGKITALLLSLLGCYLIVGGYQIDLLKLNRDGIIGGLLGSLFFAFYSLYGEKGLRKYDPWTLLLYGFGLAAIFYWILVSPLKIIQAGYPLSFWLAFLYITLFSTLLPYGFYFKGIERIRATRAGITATWEPVIAGITAYLVLGEVLHPLQVVGGLGVIAAVALLQIIREKASPSSPIEVRQKGD